MKKYGRAVAEAIDEYDAETKASAGAVLSAMPLAKHDAKYHHGSYYPGSYCKYREQLAEGDEYDRLDPENVEGEAEELARIKALKKAAKEREKAARYEEAKRKSMAVTEKTLAALERDYTAREEALCDEAMAYAMNGEPAYSMDSGARRDCFEKLSSPVPRVCKGNITAYFESIGGFCNVDGIGRVNLTRRSATSILAHHSNKLSFALASAIWNIDKCLSKSMIVSVNQNWKGRSGKSIQLVAPVELSGVRYVLDMLVDVNTENKANLYNLKLTLKSEVEEAAANGLQRNPVRLSHYSSVATPLQRDTLYQNFGHRVNEAVEGLKKAYVDAMKTPSLLAKQWLAIKYNRALRKVREMALGRYLNSDALEAY